jgi:hypothetical protein
MNIIRNYNIKEFSKWIILPTALVSTGLVSLNLYPKTKVENSSWTVYANGRGDEVWFPGAHTTEDIRKSGIYGYDYGKDK